MNFRRTFFVKTICCLLVAAGCGGEGKLARVAVEGTVAVDGTPLADGTILFVPVGTTPGPKAGATIHQGRFAIEQAMGPAIGEFQVEVNNEPTDWGEYSRTMHETSADQPRAKSWSTTVNTTADGPNQFHLDFTAP